MPISTKAAFGMGPCLEFQPLFSQIGRIATVQAPQVLRITRPAKFAVAVVDPRLDGGIDLRVGGRQMKFAHQAAMIARIGQ